MRFLKVLAAAVLTIAGLVAVPVSAAADPVDEQWYLDDLQVEAAHEIATGKNVTIGIIDSGVDADHPNLEGAVIGGEEFGEATDYATDDEGHGTAMASVMVGRGVDGGILGIAPDAKLVVAALDTANLGSRDGGWYVIDAINYLVDQEVDIISVSLGFDEVDGGEAAVTRATEEFGIPVVAAVGNSVSQGSISQDPNIPVAYPAAYTNTLCVTASNPDGDFSEWSRYGKYVERDGDGLTVSAPGEDIPVAEPGGGYADELGKGTSLATPIVAGTLALVKQHWPTLEANADGWADLVNQVLDTATDEPDDLNRELGWGIVNPLAALETPMPGHEPLPPGEAAPDEDTAETSEAAPDDEVDPRESESGVDTGSQAAASSIGAGVVPLLITGMVVSALAVVLILVALVRRSAKRAAR